MVLEFVNKYQDSFCLYTVNNPIGENEKLKNMLVLELQKYTLPPRG